MNRYFAALLMMALFDGRAAPNERCDASEDLKIARAEQQYSQAELPAQLWHDFAAKPEHEAFSDCTRDHWRERFVAFAARWVADAHKQKLEADGLARVLERLPELECNKGLALLPVEVCRAKSDAQELWVVVCLWERDEPTGLKVYRIGDPTKTQIDYDAGLKHVRVFGFDAKSGEVVSFQTCE